MFEYERNKMTQDKNKTPEQVADEILKNMEEDSFDNASEQESVDADPIAALNAENQNLNNEVKELKDRLLRSIAEMENLRKRTEREINEARSFAIANFARDMLGATDNLARAMQVVPQELRQSSDANIKSLIDGIEMTEREMQRLLQKHGITEVPAMGEKFDPHFHQAMFEVPNTGKPDKTIVEVVQPGFAIGKRILRPAMVGVAKNAGKPSSEDSISDASNVEHIDKQA